MLTGGLLGGLAVALLAAGCASSPRGAVVPHYDLLIRNGLVYDGSGAPPRRVDLAVRDDRIAALLAPGTPAQADRTVDAAGQAVAPGFINVLSWGATP